MAAVRGDDERASADFATATDAFDRLRRPFWGALTRLDHGEWLLAQGRAADAEVILAQASATFADLGAQSWLARANSARHPQAAPPEAVRAMPA